MLNLSVFFLKKRDGIGSGVGGFLLLVSVLSSIAPLSGRSFTVCHQSIAGYIYGKIELKPFDRCCENKNAVCE